MSKKPESRRQLKIRNHLERTVGGRWYKMIDQPELKKVITYNKRTGIFKWRIRMGSRALPGQTAGHLYFKEFARPHG